MIRNHTKNSSGFKPSFFILAALMFSFVIYFFHAIFDAIVFYPEQNFITILFPAVGSHEFYIRIMIIFTFLIFGIFISNFLSKEIRIQSRLYESEIKFKTVANYTKDMEYWISPRKKILFISPSCENITGYSQTEFLEDNDLINSIIFETDKEYYNSHENIALQGKDLDPIEFRIKRKDGSIIWIDHSCQSVYNSKGDYIGHRVSNRNITKRKIAEQETEWLSEELRIANEELEKKVELRTNEIRQFFNQSPFAKVILSPDLTITDVNPAFLKLFNTTMETVIGKQIQKCSFLDNPDALRSIEECKKRNVKVTSHSIYFEQIDKMLVIDAYTIAGKNGKMRQIVLNFEDVTEKLEGLEAGQELDTQIKNLERLLEYLEVEKYRISRELHDQIGQKLLLSKMRVEMLSDKYPEDSDQFQDIIDILADTNKEIRNIIYSLYPAELENYGLIEAIELLVSDFESISNFKFNLVYNGQYKKLPKNMELNIYRIFQELFNNIAKHSKAKEVTVKLTFDDFYFIAEISDDGVGIQNSKSGSKGYGMVSMNERVRVLGGQIEMTSEDDKGTKVYLEVPIKEIEIA